MESGNEDRSVEEGLEKFVRDSIESSNNSLLSSIERLIDSKLSCDKSSHGKDFDFKRKGNEKQYEVNTSIDKKLSRAQKAISAAEQNPGNLSYLKRAFEEVDGARSQLSYRNKLIKLADMSDSGWAVVAEYESHQLASDSEDEKRILKAEARASRKLKQSRNKRSAIRKFQDFNQPASQSQSFPSDVRSRQGNRRPGVCYNCGKPGHWRQDCYVQRDNKNSAPTVIKDTSKISKCAAFIVPLNHNTTSVKKPITLTPVGRLKSCINKWNTTDAINYIIDVIQNGYKLPFVHIPPSCSLLNNASSRNHSDFVSAEIHKLLELGCISCVNYVS